MRYILISLFCFIISSCATIPDQAYHKIECSIKDACSKQELDSYIHPVTNMVIKNGWSAWRDDQIQKGDGDTIDKTSFNLFYLEYAEDGQKFEGNRQLNVINRAIALSNKPVYLVVYTNSWNNNANTIIENSALDSIGFPYMLARRSFQNLDMNIIGVYVGWSGKKYKYFPATILSVQNRAHVADTIGNHGEVRADIISLVNKVQKNNHAGYSLIIGKSFGGRLLSRAFMDDLAQIKSVADWPLGDQSLLVTVNSAIGAGAFDKIYKNMPAPDPKSGMKLQRPLWINLTSRDDWVTSKMFPKARFFGQKLSDTDSGKNKTIGHYIKYLSYEVSIVDGKAMDENYECNFINEQPVFEVNAPWFTIPLQNGCHTRHLYENKNAVGIDGRYYTTVLKPVPENPYKPLGYMWNFRTDKSVIGYNTEEAKIKKNSGKHNAYLQTTLGRMADDMLFTVPEK